MTGAKRSHDAIGASVFVVILALPILLYASMHSKANQSEDTAIRSVSPQWSSVGERQESLVRRASIRVSISPSLEVLSPADGMVTSVNTKLQGSTIRTGSSLLSVDGVKILAWRDGRPFFRDLRRGDQGLDVESLHVLLRKLRLVDESLVRDSRFGVGTEKGVRGLQSRLRAAQDGVFRSAYVAYVPRGVERLADFGVGVGELVSRGETLFASTPVVTRTELVAPLGAPDIAVLSGHPLVISAGTETLSVVGLAHSGTQARRVFDFATTAQRDGSLTGESTSTLRVFEGAQVRLAQPQRVATIPSAAIVTDTQGASCVVLRPNPSSSSDLHRVVPIDTERSSSPEVGITAISAQWVGWEVLGPLSASDAHGTQCQ